LGQIEQRDRLAPLLQRVGYALWQLAEMEDGAASHVVIRLRSVRGIGVKAAESIIEAVEHKTLGQLLRELRDANVLEVAIANRLQALLEERNWLVHHAKRESRGVLNDAPRYEQLIARLDRIGVEATALISDLGNALVDYVRTSGVSRENIDSEATRLARSWGYDV
jgi:ribosomal protein S13